MLLMLRSLLSNYMDPVHLFMHVPASIFMDVIFPVNAVMEIRVTKPNSKL